MHGGEIRMKEQSKKNIHLERTYTRGRHTYRRTYTRMGHAEGGTYTRRDLYMEAIYKIEEITKQRNIKIDGTDGGDIHSEGHTHGEDIHMERTCTKGKCK